MSLRRYTVGSPPLTQSSRKSPRSSRGLPGGSLSKVCVPLCTVSYKTLRDSDLCTTTLSGYATSNCHCYIVEQFVFCHSGNLQWARPHCPPIMSLTTCRFYEEKYPEIDSFVMVNVCSPLITRVLEATLMLRTGQASKSSTHGHSS